MNNKYPNEILKILKEKKKIYKIYCRFYEKVNAIPKKERLRLELEWIISQLDYEINKEIISEEQLPIVLSFRDIYIGVFFSSDTEIADRFVRSLFSDLDTKEKYLETI